MATTGEDRYCTRKGGTKKVSRGTLSGVARNIVVVGETGTGDWRESTVVPDAKTQLERGECISMNIDI